MTAATLARELIGTSSDARTLPIGARAPAFEDLLSVDGNRYGLSSFADRRAIVIIFSSNRCPTAKAYADRMNRLQREYGPRGLQVLAVNANDPHLYPDESYARMIERAREDGYSFPYLVDGAQRLARAFGATCTFHVFVLDEERRLRYEGRFDDSRLPERVTTNDLANALDNLLAGRPISVARTRPFGCSLDLV